MSVSSNSFYVKALTDVIGIGVTIDNYGTVSAVNGPTWGRVTSSPNGVVTANAGSLRSQTDGTLWINTNSATAWTSLGGSGGASDFTLLDDVVGTWGTSATLQAQSVYVSASTRFDLRSAATTEAVASINMRLVSGTSTVTTAVVGGGSGTVTLKSGDTDSTHAGGTGGATGAWSGGSGDATSTLGVSGSTGLAKVSSGNSADAGSGVVSILSGTGATSTGLVEIGSGNASAGNSGNISLTTGTATGTRGVLDINVATVDFVTQATQFLLVDAAASALQIGSSGDLDMLVFVTTEAQEELVVNAALGIRTPDNIGHVVAASPNDRFSFQYNSVNTRGQITGTAVTAGGATAGTRAFLLATGNRATSDAVAGATSGAVTLQTGDTTQTGAAAGGASGAFSIMTGFTTQQTANVGGNSGPVSISTGVTDVTLALGTGGDSGGVTISSGNTDISAAVAATGGATGNVTLQSGQALSTGAGATSGSSGTVTVRSQGSADANTGTVTISTGNAGGAGGAVVSGNVTVSTGTVAGTGTTGTISFTTGNPAGAGVSGPVTITTGTTTGAANTGLVSLTTGNTATGTTGSIGIVTGNASGAGTSGSINLTPGTVVGGTRGTVNATGLRTLSSTAAGITAATTLVAADSGGTFSITPAGGGTYAITIPAPATGLTYNFYMLTSVAQTVTIAAGGAAFLGTLNDANVLAAVSGTTITFEATNDIGNYVRLRSDGTRYWVEAACVTTNKINVA